MTPSLTIPSPAADRPHRAWSGLGHRGLSWVDKLETWATLHARWILLGIVLIATAVRIVCYHQVNSGPLRVMHQWDQTDMGYYDFWARSILAGDYLSRNIAPPLHAWHKETADEWMRINPQLRRTLLDQAGAAGIAEPDKQAEYAQRAIWKQWVGPKLLYQEPAYPYLMALTYRVFSPDPEWVFAWQMLLGVASVVLVYRLALAHFGALPAVLAGLGAALAGPTLMYEATMLRDPLIAFLGLLLVWLTDGAVARQHVRNWLGLGLCVGFSLLVKGSFLAYFAGLVGILIVSDWRRWKRLAISAGSLLVGTLVMLSPLIVRNVIIGAPPMALAGKNAVPSFVQNNLPSYRWSDNVPANGPDFPRILGEANGSLFRGMSLCFKLQPNVRSILWIFCCKFDAVWHWWERPDNVNVYYYRLYAPILGLLVTYWVVVVPGLVGLVLSLRQFRRHWGLYLLILMPLTQMVLFSVMARYRLPILLGILPFAGYALVQTTRWLLAWRWEGLAAFAALVAVGAWTGRPVGKSTTLVRTCDAAGCYRAFYELPVSKAIDARDWSSAAALLDDFLNHEPPVVGTMNARHPARCDEEWRLAQVFAGINRDCARLHHLAQHPTSESTKRIAKAQHLEDAQGGYNPDDPPARTGRR